VDINLEDYYSKWFVERISGLDDENLFSIYIERRNDIINLRNVLKRIIFKNDMKCPIIEPSSVTEEWMKFSSTEALFQRLRYLRGIWIKDISHLEDDILFELVTWKGMEDLAGEMIRSSPFGVGLLLYFILMKRSEINKLKIITKFVKEDLDRKDLRYLLGLKNE